MTSQYFNDQMRRMTGLRFHPAELGTHWEVLKGLPDNALYAAVSLSVRSRSDFPTPAELLQDADTAMPRESWSEPDRGVDLPEPVNLGELPTGTPIVVSRVWKFYCERCSDGGMESFWCGGGKRQPWIESMNCSMPNCRKLGEGYGHEWVQGCPCSSTNPALVRKREHNATYASQVVEKRR